MATTVSRIYHGFRGVDLRSGEGELYRSPDALNVWRDYKEAAGIRTRPSMELFSSFDETVYGIFFFKDEILVHADSSLYRLDGNGGKERIWAGLCPRESSAFVYEDIWYFKDGQSYLSYDGTTVSDVIGFVPTTSIGRSPSGGGTAYQDVNMLSPYRINTFLGDGSSISYYLDTVNIDSDFLPEVKVNGKAVPTKNYSVNYGDGVIVFLNSPPSSPLTDGQDNVEITYKKTVPEYRESILRCTLLQVFDNRVFFSGDPDRPHLIWHSSLNDPTYVSDLDYYKEGMDEAAVRGLVPGNNALWVFREPSDSNTTVFYHNPTTVDGYGKVYPSVHSSISTGCTGRAINFNDDIVFFSERGMEGISGDIMTEQVISHRSSLVDRLLTSASSYKDMKLAEYAGYLFVFIGREAFLADSRATFKNSGDTEYEWFYFQMEKEITCAAVKNGVLYLGTEGGLYTLSGSSPLKSHWTTPKDKLGYPSMVKTTNKRGCICECGGDITVESKTEDSDFTELVSESDVSDHIVIRIKEKKFKDIQLKFSSDTRFSLESITLQAFVGGYIKR